ncbi:MAG TPA: sensor domain-containing protein [Solirubrobacteraceae bacterium]|nr:sensor domain-containing protein [Solirubrobacteraceae bacterium]
MDTTFAPDPAWRLALRPLITARGWTSVTHHLLGLPLGIAYFVWLVTGLSVGAGLAITLLGIPILTLVLANVRPLLMAERGLANALLGAQLPPVAIAPGGDGFLGRLKAYWTDVTTWRGVLYLLLRFPVGTFTFTVVVATFSTALWCLAAPLLAPLGAMDLGFWEPDSVLDGLAFVPFGVVALFTAGWISEAMAVMSRELARWGAR